MEISVTLPNIALSFVCLHALNMCCCTCNAYPHYELVTANTTVAVGETLTLEYRFSERLNDGYRVFWKKAGYYIGSCDMDHDQGNECSTFEFSGNSRFNLTSKDQQVFQLMISNIEVSDAGLYECQLYFKRGGESSFQATRILEVVVVPLVLPTILYKYIRKNRICICF